MKKVASQVKPARKAPASRKPAARGDSVAVDPAHEHILTPDAQAQKLLHPDKPMMIKAPDGSIIKHRDYQRPIFMDRTTGVLVIHWSRQIGKSKVLADWAVDRCLTRPGRLVTVLSNSRDNGSEFALKCAETLRQLDEAFDAVDESPTIKYEDMRFEVRIKVKGKISRIKILAANPRTARGFSGDLIMDEFGFHEDSQAIWEAAEPILSSNPDFLCRIASTGNGRHNMFYRMASVGPAAEITPEGFHISSSGFPVSRVSRTMAYEMGVKIYDPITRKPITPEEARAKAMDKRAYDQNYELGFSDENMALLTHDLISAAERATDVVICEQHWSPEAMARIRAATGKLYLGVDVGRKIDITFAPVLEEVGGLYRTIAALRMRNMRLPDQQKELDPICELPNFAMAEIDMTGLGLGLCEYLQEKHGSYRIHGVNFATSVPMPTAIKLEGRKGETVRVTEAMAVHMLQVFEAHRIEIPFDQMQRDDLRKPEKAVSPSGRVTIASERDESGHADHFWGYALALAAAKGMEGRPAGAASIPRRQGEHRVPSRGGRGVLL